MEALPDLLEYDEQPQTTTDETFKVTDDDGAAWAIRKIRAAQERIKQVERLAQAEQARLDRYIAESTNPDRDSIRFFEGLLKEYHEAELAEDPKRKTIKLPHGKLSARSLPDVLTYDEETFVAWAEENAPAMLKTPTIDKTVAKTLLDSFDELPPGVSKETDRGYSYTVKTD